MQPEGFRTGESQHPTETEPAAQAGEGSAHTRAPHAESVRVPQGRGPRGPAVSTLVQQRPASDPEPLTDPREPRRPRPRRRPRGVLTALLAAVLAVGLAGHWWLPDDYGLGSFVESFLPWFGAPILLLALASLVRRSLLAAVATLLPVVVWAAMFGPELLPRQAGGPYDVRVVSQNMLDGNRDVTASATALKDANADVVAVQELTSAAYRTTSRVLGESYPHRWRVGTLAVWSRFPALDEPRSVDIGIGWVRAFRIDLRAPTGRVRLYNVHLASLTVGQGGFESGARDRTLRRLARAVAADASQRVVLVGDLNTAATDRSFQMLTRQLTSAQDEAGGDFGFTWPARFPMARIDHVLSRGLRAVRSGVLPATGSDHRPVVAELRLD